jgi:acyl-CoA synthetase (AMP-forming)/AMP-acid ligase II
VGPVPLLVGDVFRRAARRVPGRPAASLGGRVISFADVDAAADRLAEELRRRGIRAGDRVAWWGDTSLEAVGLFAALARVGAVFAPVNARLGPVEAEPIISLADPSLVVTDEARASSGTVTLSELVEASESGVGEAAPAGGGPIGAELAEDDPHVIFFTSGSSGRPKGVVLSHRANVLRTLPGNGATPGRATVCMFPQFHMAAWTIALGCWQAGEEVAFVEQADAEVLLATVEARRARRLYAIPAVWARILAVLAADPGRHDLSGLQEADTGTSATPPELIAALRRALPHTATRIMYGSTEAGPGAVLGPEDLQARPGSVGLAGGGVELRVDDDGEVLVRSPFLMSGYFRDPTATAAALAGGWYHTGDLGVIDADGYLSIVGRASDVIRTGGEAVAPPEVEAVVAAHPAVAEAAVVGVPDPAWGDLVCAVVVLKAGRTLELEGLRAHCATRLAPFKHPRRLVVVDALPRTAATGQVQRTLLVERLALDTD